MAGAVTQIERERDRALRRIKVLAAEIRAHEQATGRFLAPRRQADDRLYRRLREINGGRDDGNGRRDDGI
jgi:hypothetical protein